jgi:hypothetical protein
MMPQAAPYPGSPVCGAAFCLMKHFLHKHLVSPHFNTFFVDIMQEIYYYIE